ncbi:MAG: tetraacyldisaccharide 4'-kinase [Parvibaculales bacterium]
MAEPDFWQQSQSWQSTALLPLSWLYGGLEAANRLFTHAQHPGKPIICVGNLTVGGDGKTPTVQCLARHFATQNKRPAILMRGYRAQLKHATKIALPHHNAAQVGDEPLMLAHEANVYIGADRMASLRLAIADGADIFIKDDGFQNPSMVHGFNLIVIDGVSGLGNARLLPAGPLRQPLHIARQRIDAVLLINPPDSQMIHPSLPDFLQICEADNIAVYYGRTQPKPIDLSGAVIGYCGIAKPKKFAASLAQAGLEIYKLHAFGDHHFFTEKQAQHLLDEAEKTALPLITTQKDKARLTSLQSAMGEKLAQLSQVLEIELIIDNFTSLATHIDKALADKPRTKYTPY